MRRTKLNMIDLCQVVKWEQVREAIKALYPTDTNKYKSVYTKIKLMKPQRIKDKEERIVVRMVEDPDEEYYSMATNLYSLSFRRWRQVSSIPISEDALEHYTKAMLLAWFIWEITFYGNEEKMLAEWKALKEFDEDDISEFGELE